MLVTQTPNRNTRAKQMRRYRTSTLWRTAFWQ